MNKSILVFVAGALVGSSATWYFVKKKYEKIAQEEIDSVKEVFHNNEKIINDYALDADDRDGDVDKKTTTIKEVDPVKKEDKKEYKKEYKKVVAKTNYSGYSEEKKESEVAPVRGPGPYVISPEELGDEDYTIDTLTLYADGHLTDGNDDLIDDIENTVSYHALSTFGEFEPDCVYVRNDDIEMDYEICMDTRNYADVIAQGD